MTTFTELKAQWVGIRRAFVQMFILGAVVGSNVAALLVAHYHVAARAAIALAGVATIAAVFFWRPRG